MSNVLSASGLERRFHVGDKVIDVLRGVNLEVAEGETVAITGSSGSGKSTLLYILGLLDKPTAGRLLFRDQELLKLTVKQQRATMAREFGFVFQSYHLIPECNVLENVLLAERARTARGNVTPDAETRAQALLQDVGLAERLDHLPNELSGGEQQRVALARAVLNRPRLILADEPTGNLDHETGDRVFELLLEQVKKDGASMVMVTHNPALADQCDRRLHLDRGVLGET